MEEDEIELFELHWWFDHYYKTHYEKYTRLIALNKNDDDGKSPNSKLIELYEIAEVKRKQIQELEKRGNINVEN